MKKIVLSFAMAFVAIFYAFSGSASADFSTQAVIGPQYPKSTLYVKPGDVIYSPKNKSTFFAGHVAIVGTDYYIYHSYPDSDGRRKDTLSTYFGLFSTGDKFTVLRPRSLSASSAANMAQSIYSNITAYNFDIDLNDFKNNYCSKFVWQAYYYSAWNDITNQGRNNYTQDWVLPSEILSAPDLYQAGSFYK